jgi:RNA polymerase sporulation-specific sigma factor
VTEYLTREEELDLIIKAQAGDKSATGELLERHRNFIWKCARRYHLRSSNALDIEDCAQIAAIGMIKAIHQFRPDFGVVLLTFAFRCVQSEFSLAIQYNSVIKCPLKQKRLSVRFLDGIGDGNASFANTIAAPEPEVSDFDRMEAVADGRRYLEMLSGRERDIVERRLNGETLGEISLTYEISKERIRQLESLALRKLRLVASLKEKGKNAHESTVGV